MALRSLAVLSAIVSAALAQSLIPAGISSNCSAYLSALNTNTQIQSCLSPITTALAAFSPAGNIASCSSSTVDTALASLCPTTSSNACPQSFFTSQLSQFYAACPAELASSSPNPQVQLIYDALYVLIPFRQAICSKNDNGDYCVAKLSNFTNPKSSLVSTNPSLSRRDNSSTPYVVPNVTTFQDENIVFMLLQPSLPYNDLCSACTRNILTAYIDFESNALYGPGLSHSLLLPGQTSLYNNITNTCGGSFLGGALAAAGGLSQGVVSNHASRVGVQELSATLGTFLGVAGLVAASL